MHGTRSTRRVGAWLALLSLCPVSYTHLDVYKRQVLATTLALASTGLAQAQAVRTERNMSLDLASRIASATVAACSAGGYNVTAAVVDRAGQLRALYRADNAGPHTVGAAQAKAFTSASARNTTTAMLENSQKNPGAANLGQIPGFLLVGGGVDVYKRQAQDARQHEHRRAVAFAAARQPGAGAGGQFTGPGPVSYTHLDVYKRQGTVTEAAACRRMR